MIRYLKIAFLFSVPLILFSLPANFFDAGQSLCPSQVFLETECPACGLTRGVQHGIHFEFSEATGFNKASLIALFVLIIFWAHYVFKALFGWGLFTFFSKLCLRK